MIDIREIIESPLSQGADEEIIYSLTTTPFSSSAPSAPVAKIYDITDGGRTDVTSTVMPNNTPSVDGFVITLSALKLLSDGKIYRLEILFTAGGQKYEPYCVIRGEY